MNRSEHERQLIPDRRKTEGDHDSIDENVAVLEPKPVSVVDPTTKSRHETSKENTVEGMKLRNEIRTDSVEELSAILTRLDPVKKLSPGSAVTRKILDATQ